MNEIHNGDQANLVLWVEQIVQPISLKYVNLPMEKRIPIKDKRILSQILKKMIVKNNPFVVNTFCLIVAVCF